MVAGSVLHVMQRAAEEVPFWPLRQSSMETFIKSWSCSKGEAIFSHKCQILVSRLCQSWWTNLCWQYNNNCSCQVYLYLENIYLRVKSVMFCTAAYHKNSIKIIDSVTSDWLCENCCGREDSRKANVSLWIKVRLKQFKSPWTKRHKSLSIICLTGSGRWFPLGEVEIKGKKRQVKAKCKHAEPESQGQEEASAWHGKSEV